MKIVLSKKYMINSIILLTIGGFFSPAIIFADNSAIQCSKVGYTVATINGINTTKKEARDNMKSVSINVPSFYKDEGVDFQFLYNPTHTLGLSDVFDTIDQGSFSKTDDVDLLNIQNDANKEIKTQKVLLVGHSQGNFYVNNLYDKIVGTSVPKQSIGAYAVATPAAYIAGVTRGTETKDNYVTSDNDKVINKYAAIAMYSLPSNIHIPVSNADKDGHNFLNIYMTVIPDIITQGITASLKRLQSNDIQDQDKPCISAPKFALLDTIQNKTLAVTDFALNLTIGLPIQGGKALVKNISNLARSIFTPSKNLATNLKASALDATPAPAFTPVSTPVPDQTPTETPTQKVEENIVPENPVPPVIPVVNTEPEKSITPEAISEVAPIPPAPPQASSMPSFSHSARVGGGGPGDIIAPVITLSGASTITIPLNSTYTDAGATATDNTDGTVSVSTSGTVDTATSGPYTITYTAKDIRGNTATATRSVTVDDLTGPVITLAGADPLVLSRGDTFTDPGATALDAVDGTVSVSASGTVDTAISGSYPITYTATDSSGNTTTATRAVKVNGKLVPFVNNHIISDLAYNGNYDSWFCMFDNPTDRFLHMGASDAPIDMMRWQTQYRRKFNDNMTPLLNYRFIFGNNARAQNDCNNGTYLRDYSDPFYYTTKSGISITYGTYLASNSSAKAITKFYLDMDYDPTVICKITEVTHAIDCVVKQIVLTRALFTQGSTLTLANLIPHIAISPGATISPNTELAQDFTNPITYTVTAEDGTTQDYIVTTTIDSVSPSAVCTDENVTCITQP